MDSSGDETVPAIPRGAHRASGNGVEPVEAPTPDDRTVPGAATPDPDAVDDRTVPAIPAPHHPPPVSSPQPPPRPAPPGTRDPAVPADGPSATALPPARERLVIGMAGGPTLADVTADGPLSSREVVRIGADAATLLAHLHERGHPHGAVSAGNIVLAGGRAQLVHVEATATRAVTDTGIGRHRPADDVHDLGVALTGALTGPDGGALPDDTPRTLRRALAAATETDPARRPTARQLADTLGWAARDEPRAAPEPWWSTSGTAAWAFGGAAALVVLLALIGVAVLRDDPAETASTAAPITTAAPTTAAADGTAPVSASAEPSASAVPEATPSDVPPVLPTALPTALPTELPSIDLPTTLPELPTDLPELPELPSDAQGLWDRFVDWVKGMF